MTSSATETPRQQSGFSFWLDEPGAWNSKRRHLRLSGWCVGTDGELPLAIRAVVGRRIFPGCFDRDRPDVIRHLGLTSDSARCGFTIDLRVPFGRNKLEVQVATSAGAWRNVFAREVAGPFLVGPAEQQYLQKLEEAETQARYAFFIDRPNQWQKPVRDLYISGWCLDRRGGRTCALRALIDHRPFAGNHSLPRPDLEALFPGVAHATQSGFAVAAKVSPGQHHLALQLKDESGLWRQFFSEEVFGALPDAAPEEPPADLGLFDRSAQKQRFQVWFDRPANWSEVRRHLYISGWCLAESGEEIAQLRGRIGREIFPANYGVLRPDVAASVQEGNAALRSGFAIDAVVPWGRSTLILEARSARGQWETVSTKRVRGPIFWSRQRRHEAVGDYASWVALHDRLSRADRARIRHQIARFPEQPLISILLPAYDSNPKWLRRAINSVRRQLYQNWELCLVDDGSTTDEVWRILRRAARGDQRIKARRRSSNGHICAASNEALAMATGKFIALLDHDDELAPTALYFAALELGRKPQSQLLYSDEDKLDPAGQRCDPYFKPDWSPDLLTSQNYIAHLSFYATELVRRIGGFRAGFEGSQDYDLTLRCVEQIAPSQIQHLPHVLYHWRVAAQSTAAGAAAKPYAHEAALRAVREHLHRRGIAAEVVPHDGGYQRVSYPLAAVAPLVSIIIPSRDRASLLRQCVESIRARTDYPKFEIIILDNESREDETLNFLNSLATIENVEVVRVPGEFNFSKLNNLGVSHARGDFVALLNNDLEVIAPGWLTEMVGQVARPGIGAAGARLWYPDGRLQHGGVLLGVGGVATHAHRLLRNEPGYFARATLTQNFSAVTAACMLLRKETYQDAGGLDEANLPVAFNDVDLCLRLRERGLLVVWTPFAELIHHESASRGLEDTGRKQQRFMDEVAYMQRRWGHLLEADPHYNPNLSIGSDQQFKLAFPPRLQKPWEAIR